MVRREIPELNVECRMLCAPTASLLWTLVREPRLLSTMARPADQDAFGTSIDITDRKKAELEERDRFFTLSLDLLLHPRYAGLLLRRRVNPQLCTASARLHQLEELVGRGLLRVRSSGRYRTDHGRQIGEVGAAGSARTPVEAF